MEEWTEGETNKNTTLAPRWSIEMGIWLQKFKILGLLAGLRQLDATQEIIVMERRRCRVKKNLR